MQKPSVRMIAAWAAHEEFGLVAYAQAILKALGNPDWEEFSLPIRNSADDVKLMADGMPNPEEAEAYCIWSDSAALADQQGKRNILISGGLVTLDSEDPYTSSELGELVNRAAFLCFEHYKKGAGAAKDFRERDMYRIVSVPNIVQELLISVRGTRRMWGYTGIHLQALDMMSGAT